MKKFIYLFIAFLSILQNAKAQTIETITWALSSNTSGASSSASLGASNQVLGSVIEGIQYNRSYNVGTGFQDVARTTGKQLPTAYDANSYVEYKVAVPVGKKFRLTNINFYALGGGTGGAKMAVYYSLNSFLESAPVGKIKYELTKEYDNNITTGAVALINSGAVATDAGKEVADINTDIEIGQGKTLSIRIYIWAGSANRYFASKNFKLTGTLSDDDSAVATQYNLTTTLNNASAGTISKTPNNLTYDEGALVSLQATSNFSYKFVKWVDANNADAELSVSNPYVVTMDAAKNIKAVFETVATYNFTVNKTGSNWGDVKLSPEPVSGKYEAGTEVTMTVTPNAVSTFSYWEDNSTVLQRTVIVNADATYTATFDEIPFIVGWDFMDQTTKQDKTADYYAESTNTGMISAYSASNASVAWLSSAASYSPSYPAARLWTPAADFNAGNLRYLKAQFSTEGYKNIQVKSMVAASYQAYSVYKLQYSLDDISYTDVATVDISGKYNSSWSDLNATLPQEAEGKPRVYLKWVADKGSAKLDGNASNPGSDVEGIAYTNVFVYADKEIVNDTDAPELISSVPAAGSATATVNGSVVLTFNERVKAGTGNITLGAKVLSGVYGTKSVTFAYEKLSYNTSYTVTIPAGALTDMSGNAYAGITFTFTTANRTQPTKKVFDAVVAKDGSGDYLSVIDAIAAAPGNRVTPWLIYIKNGKYTGHHDIPSSKPFIHLIGQSRDGVIISDNLLSGGENAVHVSVGATMVVNSTDCYFENLTLENSWGYEQLAGPQALALFSTKDRFTLNNVYLRSYQDTYLTSYNNVSDRHYIKNSRIEGAVDFIYGAGDVFFDRDTISVNRDAGGYIVAPSHKPETAYGYVFSDCILMKDRVSSVITYLGRPWQGSPKTVFLNTRLLDGISIYPKGWYYKMGAIPAVFADYNTMDINGNAIDLSQRIEDYEYDVKDGSGNVTGVVTGKAKKSLTPSEAAGYSYENVILRSGDSWDPRLMTEAPDKPTNLSLNNNELAWNEVDYARLYIIFRNNQVIGFSLNGTYTDATAVQETNYAYKVQAVGEFGALSAESELIQTLPITGLQVKAVKAGQSVQLNWSTLTEKGTSHFTIERTIDGKNFEELGNVKATGNSNIKQTYYFTDHAPLAETNIYRIKAIDFDGHTEYSDLVSVRFTNNVNIAVYPNPATEYIKLSSTVSKNNISIYDMTGKKVFTAQQVENNQNFNISGLPIGIYIVEINDVNGNNHVTRLVKK